MRLAVAACAVALAVFAEPTTVLAQGSSCAGNPNAIGVARTVEIDTSGGPGFGFEHFRQHDFLDQGEVVLTFDDGPWPQRTPAVLQALAAHCTRAIFFPIGKHATYEPGILKQVAAAGHSVGSHTWSHQNLAARSVQEGKDEIEKGISAVAWAAGGPTAPFFPLPSAETSAGTGHLSRRAQHRDLLDRHGFLRLQDAQARAGAQSGDGEAEEVRQRHCADA
jgi:peptidoglycan/xylan/chitin deacetylase (PgdA/CDA1 family)